MCACNPDIRYVCTSCRHNMDALSRWTDPAIVRRYYGWKWDTMQQDADRRDAA